MGFQIKTDYCGLTSVSSLSAAIVLRDDADNVSAETYQPQGQDGSYVGLEVYGSDAAPTNSYGIKGDISTADGDIKLNSVTTVDNKPYALESVEVTTAAAAAPTMSATAQLVETGATTATNCIYEVPALALTTKQHAQILFGAFTLTGTGCTLTACNATIGGTINKDKVAGTIIGSDINSGVITVSGTVLQTSTTAPTVTAAAGWTITSPLTCTNPETEYKSYTFELQKNLAKAVASAQTETEGES